MSTPFDNMEDDDPYAEEIASPRAVDYLEAAKQYAENHNGTQRIYDAKRERNQPTARAEKLYTEPCKACKGSGVFRSYTGRVVGNCYTCNGTKVQTFKTSPESRASSRASAERARVREAERIAANIGEFMRDHKPAFEWLEKSKENFEFAGSLWEALHRFGELSEKQLAAVYKCIAKEDDRRRERTANAPVANAAPLEAAFEHAKASGLQRPSLYFSGFRFSPAAANSANPGAIYAKATDGTYLGKVQGGKFFKSYQCDTDTQESILRVVNDPKQAAIDHGKLTGGCCVCNRTLTDPVSVANGIGPICAERMGW